MSSTLPSIAGNPAMDGRVELCPCRIDSAFASQRPSSLPRDVYRCLVHVSDLKVIHVLLLGAMYDWTECHMEKFPKGDEG